MPAGTALTAAGDVVLGTMLCPPTIPCRWGTWTEPPPPGFTQMSAGKALTAVGDVVLGRMLSAPAAGWVVVKKANRAIPNAAAISTADAMLTIARRVGSKDTGVLVFMAELPVVGMRRCAAAQWNAARVSVE
jgi:hypothetical protein